jgi:proline dehydrogenase
MEKEVMSAPTLKFDDTEIAFKWRSNEDLRKAWWLFRMIGRPALVNIGATLGPLALKLGFKGLIRKTLFRQFIGGETISDCLNTINELGEYHIGSILDYSVEGKDNEADFEKCYHETMACIDRAARSKHIPFSVFKVTGLAPFAILEKVSAGENLTGEEEKTWQRARSRVLRICSFAFEKNVPVFIDAEESWIQQAIDDLADENMLACNKQRAIVFNTFQLYRKDRLDFLGKSISKAKINGYYLGAKLVRGAYMEKERKRAAEKNYPSPIQPDKEHTDADFNTAIVLCLDNIDMLSFCAGTHNEKSSVKLVGLMTEKKIAPADKRIWFSQLYGMSDHISFNLAWAGYNVAKYVPYGPVKEVLPYLIRRAQENTSVKGQTGRELNLISKEIRRRRQKV